MSETDPAKAFLARLTAIQADGAAGRATVDLAISEEVRRAGIPHRFDEEVLAMLLQKGDLSVEHAAFEAILLNPAVIADPGGYAVHDEIRKTVLSSWLERDRITTFRDISERLAKFFLPIGLRQVLLMFWKRASP